MTDIFIDISHVTPSFDTFLFILIFLINIAGYVLFFLYHSLPRFLLKSLERKILLFRRAHEIFRLSLDIGRAPPPPLLDSTPPPAVLPVFILCFLFSLVLFMATYSEDRHFVFSTNFSVNCSFPSSSALFSELLSECKFLQFLSS